MSNITLADGSTPSTPTTGNVKIFIESDVIKSVDDTGTVSEYVGAGNVTTAGTLPNNFLVHGEDGTDVGPTTSDGTAGLFIDDAAQVLTLRAAFASTVSYHIHDSSDIDKLTMAYNDNTDTSEIRAATDLTIVNTVGELTLQSVGNVDLVLDGANGELHVARDSGDDSAPMLRLNTTGGTNPGQFRVHGGNRDPSGVVSTFPGSLYTRDGGTSSRFYINVGASFGTVWEEILTDVTGVLASVGVTSSVALAANFMMVGNGLLDSKIAGDGTSGIFTNSGSSELRVRATTGSIVSIGLQDDTGTDQLKFSYDDNLNFAQIIGNEGLFLESTSFSIVLDAAADIESLLGSNSEFHITRNIGLDTESVFRLQTITTNGARYALHLTDRDPIVNSLTTVAGTYWAFESGANSDMFLNVGSSGSTSEYLSLRQNSFLQFGNRAIQQNGASRYLDSTFSRDNAGTDVIKIPLRRGIVKGMRVVNLDTTGANGNDIRVIFQTSPDFATALSSTTLIVNIPSTTSSAENTTDIITIPAGTFAAVRIEKPSGATAADTGRFIVTLEYN